jgi:Zn-dependent membrane protease YugP
MADGSVLRRPLKGESNAAGSGRPTPTATVYRLPEVSECVRGRRGAPDAGAEKLSNMPVVLILALVILLGILLGPQWWVRRVLARHGAERPDLPGSGGELARHLLDAAGLHGVKVELTGDGDHYDPEDRAVRLLPQHHDGRSVAAVAVAAHEVSHAVQHANGERAFALRFEMVRKLIWIDRLASGLLLLAPVVFILVKAPILLLVQVVGGLLLLLVRVAVHVVTLPVELDASFAKALPVLERGRYLTAADMPAARSVLRAAAWTYVAAALVTLLDVARWFRILRF